MIVYVTLFYSGWDVSMRTVGRCLDRLGYGGRQWDWVGYYGIQWGGCAMALKSLTCVGIYSARGVMLKSTNRINTQSRKADAKASAHKDAEASNLTEL